MKKWQRSWDIPLAKENGVVILHPIPIKRRRRRSRKVGRVAESSLGEMERDRGVISLKETGRSRGVVDIGILVKEMRGEVTKEEVMEVVEDPVNGAADRYEVF
jgi:hypothetical protein